MDFPFLVFYAADANLHSVFVEGSVLGKIYHVKSDRPQFFEISDSEIKPLVMHSGISVLPHKQIVLGWAYHHNAVEVAAFKSRVK